MHPMQESLDEIVKGDHLLREHRQTTKVLKDTKSPFQAIKEKIRMARKPRMRTVVKMLCDRCDSVIMEPEGGYIVHGNIYVADPTSSGGLVGNNFPDNGNVEDVQKSVFCIKCMLEVLGLSPLSKIVDKEGWKYVDRNIL